MLRIRVAGKFPSNIYPQVMKDLLVQIVYHRISESGYVPDEHEIQQTIKNISHGRCTRQMFVHIWINNEIEMNTVRHRSQYKPPEKKKLKKKTKDFLDTLKVKKTKESCSICLKQKFKGVVLPCGHIFHKSCIKKACQYDKRCPNCRKPIKV